MIFGEKSQFAIEYVPDEEDYGHLVYGNMRFWIGEQPVGDFEKGGELYDVVADLDCYPEMAYKPEWQNIDIDAFFAMYDQYYEERGRIFKGGDTPEMDEAWRKVEEMYGGVGVKTFPSDAFYDYHVYVFDTEDRQRIFWRNRKSPDIRGHADVAKGTYQAAKNDFIAWGLAFVEATRKNRSGG
jgi:hypothetical protein